MNSGEYERFLELAMKQIAGQATATERAELESALDREPERRAEFARLQADARLAQSMVPLDSAERFDQGAIPELPGYARQRLQAKVRQALMVSGASDDRGIGKARVFPVYWRWVLGALGAMAVLALVFLPTLLEPGDPVIRVAMFDPAGPVRGAEEDVAAALHEAWPAGELREFKDADALQGWLDEGGGSPRRPLIRVVYDRTAAELRVSVLHKGDVVEEAIPVQTDLRAALQQAKKFIESTLHGP